MIFKANVFLLNFYLLILLVAVIVVLFFWHYLAVRPVIFIFIKAVNWWNLIQTTPHNFFLFKCWNIDLESSSWLSDTRGRPPTGPHYCSIRSSLWPAHPCKSALVPQVVQTWIICCYIDPWDVTMKHDIRLLIVFCSLWSHRDLQAQVADASNGLYAGSASIL